MDTSLILFLVTIFLHYNFSHHECYHVRERMVQNKSIII
jgi:hypothetical protein